MRERRVSARGTLRNSCLYTREYIGALAYRLMSLPLGAPLLEGKEKKETDFYPRNVNARDDTSSVRAKRVIIEFQGSNAKNI